MNGYLPIEVKIGNVTSQLVTSDTLLIKKVLMPVFRFRPAGYIFDPRYKRRIWDGWTNFMDEKGRFLTGLWPEVEEALKKLGRPYTVAAKTTPVTWKIEPHPHLVQVIDENGKLLPMREFGIEFLNRAKEWERGVIKAATGAGKTAIIAGLVMMTLDPKTREPAPTLIMMRSKTLAEQTRTELISMGVPKVGIVHGGRWEPDQVTICLFQSVHKLKELFPFIELLIVDECHEAVGKQGLDLYKELTNTHSRFGLSATPFKPDNQVHNYRVLGYFGPMLGEVTTSELQDQGILSESLVHVSLIDEPHEMELYNMQYQEAYEKLVVQNLYFHERVAEIVQSQCRGRTLIIVERIDHGDLLASMIPGAIWIQGSDNDATREFVRQQLRTAKGDIVAIASRIFTTGIDIRIHNFINAAGMKAFTTTVQKIGRGLRTAGDKDILHYYDFYFSMNKYLERHSKARLKILRREGHSFQLEDNTLIQKVQRTIR